MLPELAAGVVLRALTAYVVLGGADFGAGFWDLTAGGAERGAPVRAMIKRGMSPVWEANHVWLIFVLVVLWTAFPEAFGSIMSTLAIPLFVAALGIVLRGGAFALKGEAATIGEARALGATFALSSVVTPFFLGAAAGAIAAGEVPVGNAAGDEWGSWTGALPILVGLIAVASGAHLAAVFLGADARRAGRPELVHAFRRRALGSGVVAGALGARPLHRRRRGERDRGRLGAGARAVPAAARSHGGGGGGARRVAGGAAYRGGDRDGAALARPRVAVPARAGGEARVRGGAAPVSRLTIATIACFVLGAGLLFPFEHTVTIAAGVVFLLAFVVCGVFLLASPERLSDREPVC